MTAPYHKAVQGTTCAIFLPVRNEVLGNTKLQDQQPVKAGQQLPVCCCFGTWGGHTNYCLWLL